MNVPMADLQAQHGELKEELRAAFDQVMAACDFGGLGENTVALEQEVAKVCGSKHALGVNSGTDALLLALLAMGVGPGDEVITSSFTFIATGETICLAGATPVFADIDPLTYNLNPEAAEAAITSRTKVILPVHLFGQLADMTRFSQIAAKNSMGLLSDAAQAIGATHQGKPLGAWGDANTLSFYPTKNLGACGDGGMVLTDREDLAEQIKLLRFHGSGGKGYFHKEIGYCSRLDGMQAALLRVKARRLTAWNDTRRANAAVYDEALQGLDGLALPCVERGNHHVYHQYTVRVAEGRREALQAHLKSRGVQSAIYYPLPIHLQEAYAFLGNKNGDLPESERASLEVLSLPVHPELSREQVEYAADAVTTFFQ